MTDIYEYWQLQVWCLGTDIMLYHCDVKIVVCATKVKKEDEIVK